MSFFNFVCVTEAEVCQKFCVIWHFWCLCYFVDTISRFQEWQFLPFSLPLSLFTFSLFLTLLFFFIVFIFQAFSFVLSPSPSPSLYLSLSLSLHFIYFTLSLLYHFLSLSHFLFISFSLSTKNDRLHLMSEGVHRSSENFDHLQRFRQIFCHNCCSSPSQKTHFLNTCFRWTLDLSSAFPFELL